MDGIRLDTIPVVFSDERGVAIVPSSVFDLSTFGFYDGDVLVSSSMVVNDVVSFVFADETINSGASLVLTLRGKLSSRRTSEFQLRIGLDMVRATYLAGPSAGQPVTVAIPNQGPDIISQVYVPTGGAEGNDARYSQ